MDPSGKTVTESDVLAACPPYQSYDSGSLQDAGPYDGGDASWTPSGFVGDWVLGPGGGTQTCADGTTTSLVNDPTQVTIDQTGSNALRFTSYTTTTGVVYSSPLTFSGMAATGSGLPGCFGWEGCTALAVTFDLSQGFVSADGGALLGDDGGATDAASDATQTGGSLVPKGLDVTATGAFDTTNHGFCNMSVQYLLLRQ